MSQIINWTFLETLPLEFVYLESTMAFFGGTSVYYLGVYGFGTSFTKDPNDRYLVYLQCESTLRVRVAHSRAHVLARYDGVESFGRIVGTALSPVIFDAIGYYGCYGIRSAFVGGLGSKYYYNCPLTTPCVHVSYPGLAALQSRSCT